MDVPTVAARIDGFAAEVERIESAVADLDGDLRALTERATEVSVVDDLSGEAALELYEIATERRRLHAEATRLQAAADDLTMEIESFGRWLDQASVRHEELRTDATEFADAVDALETDVNEVADASGSGGPETPDDDIGQMLFECSLRHRVLTLQALDLRRAAADLEIVDRRSESDPDISTLSVVRDHVGELEEHLSTLDDRLDAIDYAEWRSQYDPRLAAFDEELKRFSPPVDWGAVLSALQEAQNN
jgi:outer membrane murein-binding lipoprotein Lpp